MLPLRTPSTAFDSNPSLTFGCECVTLTPYSDGIKVLTQSVVNRDILDEINLTARLNTYDTTGNSAENYAVFSESTVSSVPEPTTYAMLLVGLLTLRGFSRRRNRV